MNGTTRRTPLLAPWEDDDDLAVNPRKLIRRRLAALGYAPGATVAYACDHWFDEADEPTETALDFRRPARVTARRPRPLRRSPHAHPTGHGTRVRPGMERRPGALGWWALACLVSAALWAGTLEAALWLLRALGAWS